MRNPSTLLVAMVLLGACGDDPASYSAPVGINLKAKSGDVTGGVVTDQKNVNTESGNPYGAFVADAREALGGHDPSRIEVDRLSLLLGGGSTGVTTLGQIFAGRVEVLFIMNDTNNSFAVGAVDVTATTGGGPIDVGVGFDSGGVAGDDWTRLLGGGFKVVVRGPATADFATKGADADVQATFAFAAYE